jgi:hypothetical protein
LYKIIDDYLDSADRKELLAELKSLSSSFADNESQTAIEKKKKVYKLDVLSPRIVKTIKYFSSGVSKSHVSALTGWTGKIHSLLEIKDFGGYAPFHTMERGGFLGSHIDHTHTDNQRLVHIANCIYYAHETWHDEWGGDTLFFDKTGQTVTERVAPKPNRMVFFTHDAEAFHGVDDIYCPNEVVRQSFYMDFYIAADDLKNFEVKFFKKNNKKYFHVPRLTTFVPLPRSTTSIKLAALKSRHFPGYLKNYFDYMKQKYMKKLTQFWKQ